ncbi:MAG: autotransporter outer membrane beta-barrel domain-containing protein, partial [Stenotrophomonas sp.]
SGVLTFDSSATFQVDVAANGASDFVSVGGSALLGQANTVAVATNGDWATSTRYRLLTAAGGVNGTFAGATSTLAFLDPTLSYDANNVYLTMARNDVSMPDVELAFPEVVVNTNQREVATAVEALGDGNAVYDAVVRLEVPQVVPAFDSLSGEVHAATRGALLQNRFLHDGIDRHLDGRAMSGDIAPGVSVWLAGSGGQLRTDASAENAASRVQQNGMMAGAGWQVGEALELGVAAGQQQVDNRLRERAAVAETDATEYGVYAHYRWQGLSLRGGVTRADYRTDTTRTAQVGTAFSEQLLAREDATGTTAFVRAGWSFGGPRLQLTPEIELAQVRLESDGSQERGGDSALRLASGDSTYRTGLAALKADWDISGGLQDRAVLS